MKKLPLLFASCVFSLALSACTIDGKTIDVSVTALPSPIHVRVENDEYVYWDEVPNASSYTLKINGYQESTGNSLKYSISAIMDSHIDYDVPTELHIYVMAKGNHILYGDSDWSQECLYTYTKYSVEPNRTALAVPSDINITNGVMTWSAVYNAAGYKIQINDNVYDSSSNFYNIASLFDSTTELVVSIKSVAEAGSNYKDSQWSSAQTLTYSTQQESKFGAPTNLRVESDIVKWDFVTGANDYTVVINGDYKKVTEYNECRISDLINFSGTLTIKVKANALDGISESNWAVLYNYEYIVKTANESDVRLARNLSIGRGYNLIRDDYLDTTKASSNEVLDASKLLTIGTLRTPNHQSQKYTMESTNDIDAFSTRTQVNFEYNSTKTSMLIGSLKKKIDINVDVDVRTYHYRQSVAADYTYTYKDVLVDNLGGIDRIATAVSDRFLDDINKRSNATRYFDDNELVEYLYDVYGTHVILGVTTGASFHSNYSVVTNKYDVNVKVAAAYSQSAEGGSALSIFDLQNSLTASLSEEIGVNHSDTKVNFDFYAYGGGAVGGATKIEDLKSCLDNWSKGVSEDNCRSIALTKDGGISIANLLYELNPTLAVKMEKYVSEQGRIEYQSLLDKYYTKDSVEFGITDDGEGSHEIKKVNGKNYSTSHVFKIGDEVEIEAKPNEGYVLSHWTNEYDEKWPGEENEIINISGKTLKMTLVEDYALVCHFVSEEEAFGYKVTLKDGDAEKDVYISQTGEYYGGKPTPPSKANNVFIGYFTEQAIGNGSCIIDSDMNLLNPIDAEMSLYAHWISSPKSVVYNQPGMENVKNLSSNSNESVTWKYETPFYKPDYSSTELEEAKANGFKYVTVVINIDIEENEDAWEWVAFRGVRTTDGSFIQDYGLYKISTTQGQWKSAKLGFTMSIDVLLDTTIKLQLFLGISGGHGNSWNYGTISTDFLLSKSSITTYANGVEEGGSVL